MARTLGRIRSVLSLSSGASSSSSSASSSSPSSTSSSPRDFVGGGRLSKSSPRNYKKSPRKSTLVMEMEEEKSSSSSSSSSEEDAPEDCRTPVGASRLIPEDIDVIVRGDIRLGEYEVVKILCETFGTVFLSRHKSRPHEKIVVKRQPTVSSGGVSSLNEGVIHRLLTSPEFSDKRGSENIIAFLGEVIDLRVEIHSIITEYCPLGSVLDMILEYTEHFSDERVIRGLFHDMVDGLSFMHEMGIAHLDVKLDNMLLWVDPVSQRVRVKYCDFGFAVISSDEMKINYGRGSKEYACPQTFQGIERDAKVSDMWCLGVCLYVMLNHTFPFPIPKMDNKHSVGFLVFRMHQRILHPFSHKISVAAEDLVRGLLEPLPSQRSTIGDIRHHIWYTNTHVLPFTLPRSISTREMRGTPSPLVYDVTSSRSQSDVSSSDGSFILKRAESTQRRKDEGDEDKEKRRHRRLRRKGIRRRRRRRVPSRQEVEEAEEEKKLISMSGRRRSSTGSGLVYKGEKRNSCQKNAKEFSEGEEGEGERETITPLGSTLPTISERSSSTQDEEDEEEEEDVDEEE